MASRHRSRMAALQALFAADTDGLTRERALVALGKNRTAFGASDEDVAFTEALVAGVTAKLAEIDAIMVAAAPEWPLNKIAPIDRATLRIGIFELLFADASVPPKVAVDEAIELAKAFGGESSASFVSGVMGTVYKEREQETGHP